MGQGRDLFISGQGLCARGGAYGIGGELLG